MIRSVRFALLGVVWLLAGCGPRDLSLRLRTEDMKFQVLSEPLPPRAREPVRYKVVVHDTETGEPIEAGRGQIYSTSRDGVNAYAPLEKGEELGTYYATLQFITAGEWAMAIRFQRDTTMPLRTMDWMQEIYPARPE
jgi:hypothetical protein